MNLECVENMLNIYENTDVHVFHSVFCVKCIKVKINVKRIFNLKISRWALVEGVHFHDSRLPHKFNICYKFQMHI